MNEKDLARFWVKVDVRSPLECWNWTSCVCKQGYGKFMVGGRLALAHRVSAFIYGLVDSIAAPKDRKHGGLVLHRCDNPKCCNPWHLEAGTQSKNLKDAFFRGRMKPPIIGQSRGENNGNTKLTAGDIASIRQTYAAGGVSQRELGAQYGVAQTRISDIITRKTWRHV